jgi:monoamine oxidase
MNTESYDVIIIGSGVAGLYLATELLRRKRKQRIVVIEKYKEIGGRAYTFKRTLDGKELQWEAGGARISEHHHMIRELMRRYKLTWTPIGGGVKYIDGYGADAEKDYFDSGIPVFLQTLWSLPNEVLAKSTVRQLLTQIHGPAKAEEYLIRFPYRAEADTMRADIALRLFTNEFRGSENYGICGEGLSAIIEGLRKEFEAKGGTLLLEHTCMKVEQDTKKGPVKVTCMKDKEPVVFEGKHCVLAVPVDSLKSISPFEKWEGAKHLAAKPLLRFYGVFPDSSWAKERIVTATKIRYMIPGNPAIGSVQMSYTDSQDAEAWKEKLDQVGEKAVGEEILGELRRLIQPTIPPPTFVKAHYWSDGATYWLPGSYDPAEKSKEAYRPLAAMPSVHLCGESFSMRQGWMEGAVEHAAGLCRLLA